VMRRDRSLTASPNAGWTMAAMAGALGVTLEKPGAYRLGTGPLPDPAAIDRANKVFALAVAVSAAAMVTGAVLLQRLLT
jgi:adenosylcobinamide-phosphate synthase